MSKQRNVSRATAKARSLRTLAPVIAGTFLLLVSALALTSMIPLGLLYCYLALSVTTFVVYAFDKSAARRGARRTPEKTLHVLALVGGWPGALVAQQRLRHKSSKKEFLVVFWITVGINTAGLVWLLTPNGADAWQRVIKDLLQA